MPIFRKKPVEIEARELTPETAGDIVAWLAEHGVRAKSWSKPPMKALSGLLIPTLEGPHEASWGDWIIKDIAGEFYPCKPDIFANRYEKVSLLNDNIGTSDARDYIINPTEPRI